MLGRAGALLRPIGASLATFAATHFATAALAEAGRAQVKGPDRRDVAANVASVTAFGGGSLRLCDLGWHTLCSMPTKLCLDPELAEVVERARHRAAAAGELIAPRVGPLVSPLPPKAQRVLGAWLDDGGYDAAIAEIVAEDPELANQ